MVLDKPKLLLEVEVRRRRYLRRFAWLSLALVAVCGALIALDRAAARDLAGDTVFVVGQIAGLVLVALLLLRALSNLVRGLRTRNETLRFFDRGFSWKRGKTQHKYGWTQLKTFRQGAPSLRLGRWTLLQRGAHVLTMRDGQVFRFTPAHGDMRQFVRLTRPYVMDVTGTTMGRALRSEKSIRLHPQLIIQGAGVVVGKQKIRWSELDVKASERRLVIYRKNASGRFKQVKSYPAHRVDNLAGFVDIAESTIRNHQPERFNIKTHGGV